MKYPLEDGLLLIRGGYSFLLIGKAKEPFALCIETAAEEFCQGVRAGDVIVVSAPEGGPVEPALMLMDLVRTYHVPLLVLPKDHPGSRRLSRVVSVAPAVLTSSSIQRGTHPGQHLVCASDELSGISIHGTPGELDITGLPAGASLQTPGFRIVMENP